MSENIRNIGRRRGELDVHYATPENVDIEVRAVQRSMREPIVPAYAGLLDLLSRLWSGNDFNERNVDSTGVHRKFTMLSKVTYSVKGRPDDSNITEDKVFERNAYMHIGIPDLVNVSVRPGLSPVYPNPAISEANFAVLGAYNERSSQKAFSNRFSIEHQTYMTASAMQMAWFYMNHFLLPRLCGTPQGFHLAAIPKSDYRANPTSDETCLMPAELSEHHSCSVLSCVHAALTSRNILGVAYGENNISRVYCAVDGLCATEVTEDDFWEAWHLLKHTSQGSSQSDQWDMDFVLLVIQNFPLHGVSDEGGVWRNMMRNYCVCPNACIVTSKFSSNAIGYNNITDKMVIGTATFIQSVVSRALFESKVDNTKFMLEPNPSGGAVNTVLQSMKGDIVNMLFDATKLAPEYWEQFLTTPDIEMLGRERHMSRESANYMKNYSPFMMTYSVGITGDKLGKHEFIPNNPQPLVFSGHYNTNLITLDNELFIQMDMNRELLFSDGLFYINPKVNADDGIMELVHCGAFTGENRPMQADVPLVDGRMFSYGQSIGDVIWHDNRDVIPTTGDLMSVSATTVLLSATGVRSWINRGDYKVSVGRYYATEAVAGESQASSKTRISLINARNRVGYVNPYGSSRPRISSVENYLVTWKRMSLRSAHRLATIRANNADKTRERFINDAGLAGRDAKEVESALYADAMAQGDEFEKIKNFMHKLDYMIAMQTYDVNDELNGLWSEVNDLLDDKIDFELLTISKINEMTKDKDKHVLFRYAYGKEARRWDEDVMLSEAEVLVAEIGVRLDNRKHQRLDLALAIGDVDIWNEYFRQMANGLLRAQQSDLLDARVDKQSQILYKRGTAIKLKNVANIIGAGKLVPEQTKLGDKKGAVKKQTKKGTNEPTTLDKVTEEQNEDDDRRGQGGAGLGQTGISGDSLLEALLGGDLQSSGFKAGVPEEKHDDDEAGGEGDSEPLGIDDTVSVNENAPQGGMSLNEKPSPTVE
jgi:hypothetical protein